MFSTPLGRPASTKHWTTCAPQSGVSDAGLKITGLPATGAGAIFHAGIAIGKFHGVTHATTPSGSRTGLRKRRRSDDGERSPVGRGGPRRGGGAGTARR